jgi:uncharacterized protein YecE (DUF72 family)
MEVQETFYRRVRSERLRGWRERAGDEFTFTMKAFQGLTHPASSPTWRRSDWKPGKNHGLLKPTDENLELWEEVIDNAKALRAEAVVVQLPPSFKNVEEHRRNLFAFFSKAILSVKVAIEFRHASWFVPEIGGWMDEMGILQALDPFTQRKMVRSDVLYFRLHGREKGYRYQYRSEELRELKEMIKEGFVMFNNLAMLEDCNRFIELLKGGNGEPLGIRRKAELGFLRLKFPIKVKDVSDRYGYIRVGDKTLEEALIGYEGITLNSLEELIKLVEKG